MPLNCLKLFYYSFTDSRRHSHFKGLKVINFKFTEKVLQNEVDEAILNIHLQELESNYNTTFNPEEPFTISIQVSRVTINSQGQKASVPYKPDYSVKLVKKDLKVGRWLKVNITNMVAEFFRLPRENLAIVVRVQDSKNRMSLVVPHPSSESNHVLVSFYSVFLLQHNTTQHDALRQGLKIKSIPKDILRLLIGILNDANEMPAVNHKKIFLYLKFIYFL